MRQSTFTETQIGSIFKEAQADAARRTGYDVPTSSLQLLPDSSGLTGPLDDGGWRSRSCMELGRNRRVARFKLTHYQRDIPLEPPQLMSHTK